LKFELKDIDTVLSALEQVRYVQKEIEYLKRGIAVNKEQLDSLSNRKTTLKTFFMGGSEDDKKNKLTAESQVFEERLEKETELYHILLALVEEQLMKYHQ
jgi:predicted  nucleic acid-binding Zn-ribbon protein